MNYFVVLPLDELKSRVSQLLKMKQEDIAKRHKEMIEQFWSARNCYPQVRVETLHSVKGTSLLGIRSDMINGLPRKG